MTGKHETDNTHFLEYGVANRGCLIHVGRDTEKNGKDVVTALLAETTVLWEPKLEAEALGAQKLTLNVLCS
nr:glutamine synthetase leaf isozyme, chloroplastic [Ipomoea batatas]